MRLGGTLNHWAKNVAENAADAHSVIGFMGDDHRPRTYAWDKVFQDVAEEKGTAVIYGNDLIQGGNLATAVAITTNIISTLGYMVPPGQTHLYLDNAWMDMGREVGGLVYRHDVVIEHVHPIGGKVQWDEGYKEVNSPAMYSADHAAYEAWKKQSDWRVALRRLAGENL
jgi:hypothetical protein